MMRTTSTLVKFGVFATVMAVLTAFLFMAFSQYRSGSTSGYSAVFSDASRLKSGDSVRVAGVRVLIGMSYVAFVAARLYITQRVSSRLHQRGGGVGR